MNLRGKQVNEVLIEWIGPDTERNNFVTAAPNLEIRVIGTGQIQLEQNITPILASTFPTGPVSIGKDWIADQDPANWVAFGAAIDQASGTTNLVIPVVTSGSRNFLRAIVTVVGEGEATIRSIWN